MDPSRAEVVLLRPSRPANVAGACRSMKNMGLSRLVLAESDLTFDAPEARAAAYGAWDVLDGATRTASLAEAVAGCTFVAGTSGRAGSEAWTPRRLASEGLSRAGSGRLAVVFGPEASGLRADELRLCHAVVRILSHAAQPSLNLAQAVLIVAYEVHLAALVARPAPAPAPEAPRASVGEMEAALAELAQGLVGIGYLNPQNPEPILAELRALLARAAPAPREVALLRGLARQVRWAASRIAPPERSADNDGPVS